jgi:hypothetical protein
LVLKRAEEAVAQLKGALKRVGVPNEIWCEHPRRGRVSFPDGLPHIDHAVATVEAFEEVALQGDLPLECNGTPLSYLSVSDFLNVCNELRSVPEVVRYLDARRALPEAVLRSLGAERLLFSHYLVNDGTFAAFTSLADVRAMLTERRAEFQALLAAKAERDQYSYQLEYVADQLAGRHPHYQDGLSQEVLDYYEPDGERKMYLVMQDLIAGLSPGERVELGRVFEGAMQTIRRQRGTGFSQAAAMVPSHADYVFVLGSLGSTERFGCNELLQMFDPLARAAMAHYGRKRCFIIVDRDGKSFEVAHAEQTAPPTPEELEAGHRAFGSLKLSAKEVRVRPELATLGRTPSQLTEGLRTSGSVSSQGPHW